MADGAPDDGARADADGVRNVRPRLDGEDEPQNNDSPRRRAVAICLARAFRTFVEIRRDRELMAILSRDDWRDGLATTYGIISNFLHYECSRSHGGHRREGTR